ncbi:MAG: phosphoribosylformylglycinamidine synthase subunit PurL [Planctomycetaceae bacterium]|nr:phosphoribosylformylglycinamidine synthase subunit PurL [Planctomycetaceae bacterium]
MVDSVTNTTTSSDESQTNQIQGTTTLWQVDIFPVAGQPNRLSAEVLDNARDLRVDESLEVIAAHGFLIQGSLTHEDLARLTSELLVEPVVERCEFALVGSESLSQPMGKLTNLLHVLPLPGVTDPQAESALMAMRHLGFPVDVVRTFKKFWTSALSETDQNLLHGKILCNDSIEMIVVGKLELDELQLGQAYEFSKRDIPLTDLPDEALMKISQDWTLSLSLIEMHTIRDHFEALGRAPTDIELESIAQTWSEHCSHKTLAGRISYRDENGERQFENMLKETIFSATMQIRSDLGESDWCVSVFKDNAGIVEFDDNYNIAFKVETHNRPSALEPYGGANTGIGGVIRDTLGTGLGAKPICNTDVFCFASPDTPYEELPPGVMHPRRIMKGVVSGVRDYGNRMGIPTVNGAVFFDERYVGNPLVFCGNVGLIPKEKSFKEVQPNDLIVSIGGKTGRDGIHGATFSSAELTESSDITSGGAVQIGNAITEKMLMDVLLIARDRELYSSVTDCGAGGYSSAVGEMGEELGAEVWLDRVPLKYDGLSYTEIWISEAQERMVFAIPESNWEQFEALCASESVEATVIGQFKPTGQLVLKYGDEIVGDVSMSMLHDGRPPIIREATYSPAPSSDLPSFEFKATDEWTADLCKILASPNVASKHWIIRQYDHEVQGGSVIKPLVGIQNDGPGDAAVVRPVLDSRRGLAVSCGMNPLYGDLDTYHMATSAIDEAIRNCVSVGADPTRIAILDNFCWGYTDRPETLGSLVRAAIACQDLSVVLQTPFISGKDSLHNEFSYTDDKGSRQTISIPSTLLISAMGQVPDVANCLTMDLKTAGNLLFQIGVTGDHLGGSHWNLVNELSGGKVPTVDPERSKQTFIHLHDAIRKGLVRSCHDMSEGGLAVAVAEMAFAGGLGAEITTNEVGIEILPSDPDSNIELSYATAALLFSESNTRFVVEITPENVEQFKSTMGDIDVQPLGSVISDPLLTIEVGDNTVIQSDLVTLKNAWLGTLDWK